MHPFSHLHQTVIHIWYYSEFITNFDQNKTCFFIDFIQKFDWFYFRNTNWNRQISLSLPFSHRFWHCRCTQTTIIREQPNFLYSIQPCTVLEGRKVESGAASTARNSVQMTSSNGSNVFVCNHIIFMHCLHPALSFLFCVSPSFSGCSTRDIYTFLHFFRF